MRPYSLSHVSDHDLLRDLASLVAQDRTTTAALLAHIAEVDVRRLYLPAGHPSMYAYCVHELRLAEDSAYRRITVARVARQFPAAFEALADGRLNLTAVVLLSPYLRPENADELLEAAAHKTKSDIEELLARRFPRSERLPLIVAASSCQLAPERVGTQGRDHNEAVPGELVPERVAGELAPGRVEAMTPRSSVKPVAAQRYEIQLTIGQGTHAKLQYAQSLLSHQVATGDVVEILDRALDALIVRLEKRKFAATARPRQAPRPTAGKRHIPAHVKRTVWQRDGGQCTFISDAGRRCPRARAARIRSRRSCGAQRPGDGRPHPAQMPGAQSIYGGVHVREGFHEHQERDSTVCDCGKGSRPRRGAACARERRRACERQRRGALAQASRVPSRRGASRGRILRDGSRRHAGEPRPVGPLLSPPQGQAQRPPYGRACMTVGDS